VGEAERLSLAAGRRSTGDAQRASAAAATDAAGRQLELARAYARYQALLGGAGLIDFGEVGSVTAAERCTLLRMMSAVLGRDGDALAEAVLSVSRTTRAVDRADFGAQLTALLHPVADASLRDVRLGDVLGPLLHLLRTSGIVLPSDMAILIKTMIECEATTGELDPTLSMLNLVGELASFAPARTGTDGT